MHKRRFRYATEGSVALLLGCTITGTMYVLFWLVAGEPLPRKLVRFNDQVFFDVSVIDNFQQSITPKHL